VNKQLLDYSRVAGHQLGSAGVHRRC